MSTQTSSLTIALIGTTAACVVGFRADLIRALVGAGHTVHAFAIDYCKVSEARVRALGAIPVGYRFSRSGLNPFRDLLDTWKLSRDLKHRDFDLVFSYFAKPVVFATLAARLAGIKRCLGMLEGLGYAFTERPGGLSLKVRVLKYVQIGLYALSFRFLERLIFLNPDDPQDLLGRYGLSVRKVSVLGGIGVDLRAYPHSLPPRQSLSFIFVGRLLVEKGIHEFLEAARRVKSRHPEVRFIVLGDCDVANPGSLANPVLAGYEGLLAHVGHVDDVSLWLARSSVFVLPSYREGVPRSTQEALAIGRPVITTDVPGCRETVIDGVNGFLIPPWSVSALEQKMLYFTEYPEKVEEMGRRSYELAQERFDAYKVNARLLGYFD